MDDETIIARYIEAAARIDAAGTIDRAGLEEVVRGAGLDEAALAVIEARRAAVAAMGQGYARQQLWHDAIAAWQEAADLSPWDGAPLLELAAAWLGLYQAGGTRRLGGATGSAQPQTSSDCLGAAEHALRRAIQLQPGDAAPYRALATVDKLRRAGPPAEALPAGREGGPFGGGFGRPARQRLMLLLVILALTALLVWLILGLTQRQAGRLADPGLDSPADQPSPDSTAPAAPTDQPADQPVRLPASDTDGRRDIPVETHPGDWQLTWSAIRSNLQFFDLAEPAWSYELAAAAVSGGTAFKQLACAIHFYAADGRLLFTKREAVVESHQPVHYPGDRVALSLLVYEKGLPPDIARVVVEPVYAEALAVSSPPVANSTMPVAWVDESGGAFGQGLELSLRRVSGPSTSGSAYLYVDLAYRNGGTRPIDKLKFRCEWLDVVGQVVDQDYVWGFIQQAPLLEPGRQGVCGFILNAASGTAAPASLRIIVEEASFL
ncbi:MAG: hypothetical protein A2087_01085 [Spirochaetes bacterium GWD1_61_31]|nr:MAG: hypothetical protein A2Y37_06610 [Spirochaetes bacterium GWB1_60_80]OHD30460.1 MAG: hypothetical protein A2004_07970 [Spirochaetes bacterium GWC1_61_12]OHD41290.1 MAG: hypothetical protein A2087_01085 [Spirochaetes bacterium GWD1_61_31]OHD44412.1 MAG: hypothetical protein A2Y35_09865 [Spirochaetes bacterium GWE1_60_18]OHD60854.1 MAG: hypothetical protein A2Y32_11630 [Spirochaetes bacterium GWF1_60_12]HAP43815.1 hypothetical protein [Spirochaetaceae bacterium]